MRILVVEDDEKLCEAVSCALEQQGYAVDVCHEGDDGLRWMREGIHDLVLLDRMLPVMDGVEVLTRARALGICIPVLFVTALGSINDRVHGLDAGADDYLVKPFAIEELLARVRAMCRRPHDWSTQAVLTYQDLRFDPGTKELTGPLEHCTLSKREGLLMETLIKNPARVLPREMIFSCVWGPDAGVEDGNLDNYIYFLRRRLKQTGSALEIQTVRGIGYKLEKSNV